VFLGKSEGNPLEMRMLFHALALQAFFRKTGAIFKPGGWKMASSPHRHCPWNSETLFFPRRRIALFLPLALPRESAIPGDTAPFASEWPISQLKHRMALEKYAAFGGFFEFELRQRGVFLQDSMQARNC